MKNKRWKRKAKRVYGECVKHWSCTFDKRGKCKYADNCPIMDGPFKYFGYFTFRDMEKYFKVKRVNSWRI
jgi:hypothetical protein